ncbi:DUF4981 domain-containing protein [Pedobacter changchengzhani]|uniref:beta-galactosidase n=1 Tax=Pedobacter changchengzhani TaxID=2529274 RepID=A0A4R5MKJ5_9SPHI|nr:glycoside hydrolase family 2 TIM barrel-domain containing protein [Pedobacter changchengzhani]TDG36194.1 DUF4981 domain-containing protein [Pedobacter changchengzhani]
MKFKKYLILSVFICLVVGTKTFAQKNLSTVSLGGFKYGDEKSPTGKEWESPQDLSLNKEVPHAYFFSFSSTDQARKVLPTSSDYYKSLDGTWKFNWVKTPDERPKDFYNPTFDVSKWDDVPVPMSWNILGIQKDGSLKYGVPIYVNQRVIFQHTVKVGDWKGGVMRTPPKDWTTYIYRNEVGSFRKSFEVPSNWDGRDVFLNFDGVDSFFYLWVNGKYVGFSKNSRNLAAFNISKYLNKNSKNEIAVEVYRNSDGSFLEAQDMFRLPGIFRSVYLTSKPKVSIRNIIAIPDLDATYKNGSLNINAEILNTSGKQVKGYKVSYSLFENKLFSDENSPVESTSSSGIVNVSANTASTATAKVSINNPKKWSAEMPYMYTLVATLKDNKGKTVEIISTPVGFRKVEIKDTKAADDEFGLAGRYYYINGKTVKLKGVNRHETNPTTGKVVSHTQMEAEINLMKRANINHVRTSHYSNDPYWYYLCDKYGIYLEDEANIESHEYYYGDESLSHVPEFKDAHVARNLEMVYAHINHPSIVIWSLGNEAGPGKNFVAAYDAIKKVDLSRPVQYERNNDIVDMGSNQYPSIGWINDAVKGIPGLKYPFHVSEYAHSMGNASGNLIDYWKAIESTNFFMGGAIWDWIDQAMYSYDKTTGEKYLAYGGDFGDKPNDGMFVMNGLIFADLTPKPQYYEVKKVYQNVGVKWADSANRKIEIFNKNYFSSLSNYDIKWTLFENGKAVQRISGNISASNDVAPRERFNYTLPFDAKALNPQSEYFVKIQFLLKEDMPWAKKGYSQMEEQLKVKSASNKPAIASVAQGDKATLTKDGDFSAIKGDGYEAKFDNKTGSLYALKYGENIIIRDGEGPKLDALRAPVDNDNWAYQQWFLNGLHNLKHKVTSTTNYTKPDGTVVLSFTVVSQAPNGATISGGSSGHYVIEEKKDKPFGTDDFKFTTNQIWSIYKDGSIELSASISSNNPRLALAHIGYKMELPAAYDNYSYYGRGPINNYADRKTAQNIEVYTSKVANMFEPWPKPQSTGNREEVRWCSLTNASGNGVAFIAKNDFAASALPWDELALTLAPHPYQLPKSTGTHLYLNAAVTGLGGNSCGQGPPLEKDRVRATTYSLGFIIRPILNNDLTNKVNVSTSGDAPIAITQNESGTVNISSENADAKIYYTVGLSKTQEYLKPFLLKDGGIVTAWYANNKKLKFNNSFNKITTIPLKVVFASSEETDEGEATNLLDHDLTTFWHTMYSVTVAKYPHFIDFDAGEIKTIAGFSYTPRQDSNNGNIKGYKLQVSMDGKTWGESIASGNFEDNAKAKTVKLTTPVKARFVRFTALSSQNGRDFATGAEFSLLSN